MRDRGLEFAEKQAAAIQAARRAAECLDVASVELRKCVDAADEALRDVAACGAISQDIYTVLSDRLAGIRFRRNAMETFEFLCRTRKVMDAAWRSLP